MKNIFVLFLSILTFHQANANEITPLKNWKFSQEDPGDAFEKDFNDSDWRNVTLPHDWAAEGDFDFSNDIQLTMVVQDGEQKQKYRHGRSGALPYTGIGWYRTHVTIEDTSKSFELLFDGAMSHAKVYVNGKYVGERPNGYVSFYFDISSFLIKGDNTIAVRLENFNSQSRWYPGAGLYRKVTLTSKNKNHIKTWGTFVTTPIVTRKKSTVNATIAFEGEGKFTLENNILNSKGEIISQLSKKINTKIDQTTAVSFEIENPELWSLQTPNLYTLQTNLISKGKIIDTYTTPFGIRKIDFKIDGFYLNNEKIPFNGVNMHHDLGPVGAAFYPNLFKRQIIKLKEMGVNAIRFSHNPPAPECLDLCDQYGILAIDEAFDEWTIGKVKNGYARDFRKWAKKDLTEMIHRDRNHPSIIMWSIGNEILEQYKGDPENITGYLNNIVKTIDTTRATTCGFNSAINALKSGMAEKVDVAGFNYKPSSYHIYRKKFPNLKFYASETGGTVSVRDSYKFPVVFDSLRNAKGLSVNTKTFEDGYPGNYETTNVRWGYPPFKEFASLDYNKSVYGEFVWTGYDYLGEPSPYHNAKSRSSYFAPIDFVGLEKDKFYLYKSRWNTKENTLHVFPHWTWPSNKELKIPVVCYTNYARAELFVNGKSKGIQTKKPIDPSIFLNNSFDIHGSGGGSFKLMNAYAMVWKNISYEPGKIEVVAYDKNGIEKERITRVTANKVSKLKITPEIKVIKKGEIAVYIIEALDSNDNVNPHYQENVKIEVSGAGEFTAAGNGDPTNLQNLSKPERKFFNGKAAIFVKATNNGSISIKITTKDFAQENNNVIVK